MCTVKKPAQKLVIALLLIPLVLVAITGCSDDVTRDEALIRLDGLIIELGDVWEKIPTTMKKTGESNNNKAGLRTIEEMKEQVMVVQSKTTEFMQTPDNEPVCADEDIQLVAKYMDRYADAIDRAIAFAISVIERKEIRDTIMPEDIKLVDNKYPYVFEKDGKQIGIMEVWDSYYEIILKENIETAKQLQACMGSTQ